MYPLVKMVDDYLHLVKADEVTVTVTAYVTVDFLCYPVFRRIVYHPAHALSIPLAEVTEFLFVG
jgi:hypothetical protein